MCAFYINIHEFAYLLFRYSNTSNISFVGFSSMVNIFCMIHLVILKVSSFFFGSITAFVSLLCIFIGILIVTQLLKKVFFFALVFGLC